MRKVIMFVVLPALIIGGGYYLSGDIEFGGADDSSALKTLAVPVPPPSNSTVAQRSVVPTDRQSIIVAADQLKGLYRESYFKKIQLTREAELDAKIAENMRKVRDAGYIVDGDTFTLSQSNLGSGQGADSSIVETKSSDKDRANMLDESYYEARAMLSSMRLLMTEGDSATFDIAGEYFELGSGESIGNLRVDSIQSANGVAVVSSAKHGLSRTLMISKRRVTAATPQSDPAKESLRQPQNTKNLHPAIQIQQPEHNAIISPLGNLILNRLGGDTP